MQNEFQQQQQQQKQQQQALQNEYCGLANVHRETDRRLSDVIAGGTGRGTPAAPFAPAAVLPVPPVGTVNI